MKHKLRFFSERRDRWIVYISLLVVLSIYLIAGVMTLMAMKSTEIMAPAHFVGTYSVDGGEWKDTVGGEFPKESFHTITIRGQLDRAFTQNDMIFITAQNVWYTLSLDSENALWHDFSNIPESEHYQFSPGYSLRYVYGYSYEESTNFELTVTFPYSVIKSKSLENYLQVYVGDLDDPYHRMLSLHGSTMLFCLVLVFFGLFTFPIAGIILGGIDYRYLAFSSLCVSTGLFIMAQAMGSYLPLWVLNEELCMYICNITSFLFLFCALLYVKSMLHQPLHRLIGDCVIVFYALMTVAAVYLSLNSICDLFVSTKIAHGLFVVFSLLLTIFLIREMKNRQNKVFMLIPWLVLVLSMLFDMVNSFLRLTDFSLFGYGAVIMIVPQIIGLIFDLHFRYKETLRYQKMQQELYEAKVGVMVSQIQPHFMYNALTSIAMMCTIDPETAQEATITFSEYLRGNMDSLKQTKPVPFERELEHLKKYLYIEKLRFGKKLNVVYDLQATDFVLPQLSIQPLAENAVKYGISKKRGGGTLTIATRETDTAYEVIVSDDGKGFDVNETKTDGRSHVGMDNTRRRVSLLCGGEVKIESKIGEGTVATVILPKEGQHENSVR